jgi:hypothetical protein
MTGSFVFTGEGSMGSVETLMVGTWGWDHAAWAGSYYPEELPEDWRFGYYSNEYRAVLMPASHWHLQQPLEDWIQDADDAFRMVLELPDVLAHAAEDWQSLWQDFLHTSALLQPFRRGYLLSPEPDQAVDIQWLRMALTSISAEAPVSVRLRGAWNDGSVHECVESAGASLCWQAQEPGFENPPDHGLWVALSTETQARAQRAVIERMGAWMDQTGGEAGLFFVGDQAPAAAASARLIAEMLVI